MRRRRAAAREREFRNPFQFRCPREVRLVCRSPPRHSSPDQMPAIKTVSTPQASIPTATDGLKTREYVGYALGDTASNFFFQTFNIFLTYYYVDVWGIPATALLWMLPIVRLIGAFDDPIMGLIADRTKRAGASSGPTCCGARCHTASAATCCSPDLPSAREGQTRLRLHHLRADAGELHSHQRAVLVAAGRHQSVVEDAHGGVQFPVCGRVRWRVAGVDCSCARW